MLVRWLVSLLVLFLLCLSQPVLAKCNTIVFGGPEEVPDGPEPPPPGTQSMIEPLVPEPAPNLAGLADGEALLIREA